MPAEIKARVFSMLYQVSSYLLVTDFVANNDLTEFNSPELIYSVANFYGYIIDDVLSCDEVTTAKRWQCIYDFFLTEAITILASPRSSRVDYHAPIEEWCETAKTACFHVISTTLTSFDGTRPISFTSIFKNAPQ